MDIEQYKAYGEPFKITEDWDRRCEILKQKFTQLTDSDLKCEYGKENDLLTRIEVKLNLKREEVIHIIKNCKIENR